jgi:hypothetical protein
VSSGALLGVCNIMSFDEMSGWVFNGLLNGHLDYPQSKFQISNCHLPRRKLGIFSINIFMRTLNKGAHTSFKKNISVTNYNEF